MRRARRRGRSRGQALVEFALVITPFLLTIFGTVEFSLIIASIGTYNFAVRDATRLGTLLSRSDNTADQQVIQVATAHISGIVMATPYEIDIYRATSDGQCLNAQVGQPVPPVLEVSVDDPTCAKGVYQPSGSSWVLTNGAAGGPWQVTNRNDSLTNADYLGVRILYRYTFLTGFVGVIGSTMNLSATSAQRIEPQDFSTSDRAPVPASPSAAPVASSPLVAMFGQHGQNGVGA